MNRKLSISVVDPLNSAWSNLYPLISLGLKAINESSLTSLVSMSPNCSSASAISLLSL